MLWSGWGDPAEAVQLTPAIHELLRQGLGVRGPGPPVPAIEAVDLPEPLLGDDVHSALAAIVGDDHIRTDAEARVRHTRGQSTPDLLRLRYRDGADAPDAVVLPDSHEQICDILALCAERTVAVVPFGGGTSVVGGLQPRRAGFAGVIALDTRRLNRLLAFDEESRTATLQPGLRGPDADRLLGERGYTIGHHPQSYEYATLGGFAAARSSGQASAGYGRFDERVVGLTVATPRSPPRVPICGSCSSGRRARSA